MVNTTLLAYKLGEVTADLIFVATGGVTVVKLYAGFNSFAKLHKIASNNPAIVSENLFECLFYLE